MEGPMLCEWVVGRAVGDQAKHVMGLANEGVAYFIIESGRGQGNQTFCTYAFRRPCDSPVPEHLTKVVDPFMIDKFEKRLKSRQGYRERPTKSVSSNKIDEVRKIFEAKK